MDRDRSVSKRLTVPWWSAVLLAAIPVMFLGYFFIYPLAAIVIRGLGTAENVLDPFTNVFTDAGLRRVAWFTLWQAVVSTSLTLAVGIPCAYVLSRFSFPGRRFISAATLVPFVLPTLVVGTAFLALLGPGSPIGIDLRGTVWAILIAHVFYNLAIVIRGVGSFWEQLDPRMEEAAEVLGATRWGAFRAVTLPLLAPAIAASAALVFLFSFTSFGVILVLGNLRHTTLEVEIWRQTTVFLDFEAATALAVLQLLGVGLILVLYGVFQRRRRQELSLVPGSPARRRPRSRAERALIATTMGTLGIIVGLPIAVLVTRSLRTPDGIGIGNYTSLADASATPALFAPPLEAVANSISIAVAAVLVATLVGMLAAATISYSESRSGRVFDLTIMLPLGASAVTIGFGFLIALDRPIDLRASIVLLPIAHALVAIPFLVRAVVPVMGAVRHRLREAAQVLGASPFRAWRSVDLPLVARALLVGAAFAFAISIGEFGATAFIVRPASPTIPFAIYRLLSQPGTGNFGKAMALSVVLMAITIAAVFAIEALRRDRAEEI